MVNLGVNGYIKTRKQRKTLQKTQKKRQPTEKQKNAKTKI